MTTTVRNWMLGLGLLGVAGVGSIAFAHETANARRTVAQCQAGGMTPAQVNVCIACVRRPLPHHYHPLQRAGSRCDRNRTGR